MAAEKKEIMHDATQRAKLAVHEARDKVQENLAELSNIQEKLKQARTHDPETQTAEVEKLEKRLSQIRFEMTNSVEESAREVKQATQEAKGKLGMSEEEDGLGQPKDSRGSKDLERQPTGARDVLAPSKLTDKYPATSPRPSPRPSSSSQDDRARDDDEVGDDTPTSARASQGIVGGFLFRPPAGAAEEDKDDEEGEEDDDEGPTAEDVTASMDEATETAHEVSEGNRREVAQAASEVKGKLQ